MEAIVAVYSDWGIGDGKTQPVVLKADRERFVSLTRGAAVIVGRKTLEDFPGGMPLKGRHNIILSRRDIRVEGAEVAQSPEEALALASAYPRCLVLGGESVFKQMFDYLDTVHVTKIYCKPESSSFFPNLDEDPSFLCREKSELMQEDGISYRFCTYIRREASSQ